MTKETINDLDIGQLKRRRRRLVIMFFGVLLGSTILAPIIFNIGYNQSIEKTLLRLGAHTNQAISDTLMGGFGHQQVGAILANANETEIDQLRSELKKHITNTHIRKIVIFNTQGMRLASTVDGPLKKSPSKNALKAITSGRQFDKRTFHPETGITSVESYIPITHHNSIAGVFELYQDISPVVSFMQSQRSWAVTATASLFVLILLTISILFRRTDKLLTLQMVALQDRLTHTEASNEELERRVATRTRELQQALAKMEDHKNHLEELVEERTQDLARARDEAMEANKTKSAFLANMSHELRTPLNAIIGYSEILSEEAEELGARTLTMDIHKINTAGKHLLSLINDILDISKIEAGKMDNYIERMDVRRTIAEVVDSIQPLIKQSRNRLTTQVCDNIELMETDITKFRQILFNLISNANKFTEDGVIDVKLTREVDSNDRGWVTMEVSDTGIGMTEEQQRVLFQAFSQADTSTTRKYGGTGLGLAISQRLCQLLGGSIQANSRIDHGSTFTVVLPEVTPKNPQQDTNRWMSIGPKVDPEEVRFYLADGSRITRREKISTVLVIDDDANIRDLMERFLTRQGFNVHSAANAYEGMELAYKIDPDVITLDVMMPEKDGWSLLTELKRDPKTAHIPVIMLTLVEDREVGYALGAADYLQKPIDRNELATAINKHVRPTHQATALLVQPDPLHSRNMKQMLQSEGLHVIEAATGQLALARIQFEKPDMIFAELNMPGMTGLQLKEQLGENPEWANIPVVMMTAQVISDDERAKLTSNVEHVLFERDDEHEIMEEIHQLIIDTLRIEERYRLQQIGNGNESDQQDTGSDKK